MAKKDVRIPDPVREDIIRRIKAGEFRCDIARPAGSASSA